jgi:hypothetical protein
VRSEKEDVNELFSLMIVAITVLQPTTLVDRTVALVGGRTITLSDTRVTVALGLVDGTGGDAAVVDRLIDRELKLRETDRYAPPEPSPAVVDSRLDEARIRAGGEDGFARILEAGGFDEARLRGWIRDDFRIAAYLEQRFALDDRRADLIEDWVEDLRRRTAITVLPKELKH